MCCVKYQWTAIEENRHHCDAVVGPDTRNPSLQNRSVADKVRTQVDSTFARRTPLDVTQNSKDVSSAVVSIPPRLLISAHSGLRDKPTRPEILSSPWRWVQCRHFALVVDSDQPPHFDSYLLGSRIWNNPWKGQSAMRLHHLDWRFEDHLANPRDSGRRSYWTEQYEVVRLVAVLINGICVAYSVDRQAVQVNGRGDASQDRGRLVNAIA